MIRFGGHVPVGTPRSAEPARRAGHQSMVLHGDPRTHNVVVTETDPEKRRTLSLKMKTVDHSWRLAPETKARLKRLVRRRDRTLAHLLDEMALTVS